MEVVSVIVSGIVGIGGLAFAWWNRWLSVHHDRTLADLAAVRDVIELGAILLNRVAYALDPIKQDLETNARATSVALDTLGREYDELVERLKVRLGAEHAVVLEFAEANEATLEAFRAVQRVAKLHVPNIERGGLAEKQSRKLLDKDEVLLAGARERFDRHRVLFIDAAARTAGAKLPSS